MKTMKQMRVGMYFGMLGLLLMSVSVQASHRALLFNDKATEKILDMWPDFVESINNEQRGVEGMGERSLIIQTGLRSHINNLLREQPTTAQFADGFKILADEYYSASGMTTFGSRLDTALVVSGYQHILREENRLPIRFAWSVETHTQPMAAVAATGLYSTIGVQWQGIEANPWLWNHGMSSEGGWDAPNRGCQGDDLPAKPGMEVQVKEVLEICPDFTSPNVQGLIRGLRSGWRFVGVHGVGSYAFRIFIRELEDAMQRNPGVLTLDYVRNSRHGFAHGTLTGAVPEVVAGLLKYNIYVPINLRRALAVEPDNIRQNYGEAGWAFLGPVKTLLDAGVKVVGEGEIVHPTPETFFDLFDTYVNREIDRTGNGEGSWVPEKFGDGEVFVPEEGVDRIVALKLFTSRSADFLRAETKVGSLEVGKFADFAVIDKDYMSGPDTEVRDNKVLMTVLGGQTRYQDSAYQPTIR